MYQEQQSYLTRIIYARCPNYEPCDGPMRLNLRHCGHVLNMLKKCWETLFVTGSKVKVNFDFLSVKTCWRDKNYNLCLITSNFPRNKLLKILEGILLILDQAVKGQGEIWLLSVTDRGRDTNCSCCPITQMYFQQPSKVAHERRAPINFGLRGQKSIYKLWSKYARGCPTLWSSLLHYIYNGIIFPSLNPAKIFQFNSRWTESTKSSAVVPNNTRRD